MSTCHNLELLGKSFSWEITLDQVVLWVCLEWGIVSIANYVGRTRLLWAAAFPGFGSWTGLDCLGWVLSMYSFSLLLSMDMRQLTTLSSHCCDCPQWWTVTWHCEPNKAISFILLMSGHFITATGNKTKISPVFSQVHSLSLVFQKDTLHTPDGKMWFH